MNRRLDPQTELEVLIRARYPIIYIESYEELRVQEVLRNIARRRGKRIFQWTITDGLVQLGARDVEASTSSAHATLEPDGVLSAIRLSKENAIYILKDFHPHLDNPKIVRRLRDLANELKASYKTIILLSPTRKIPLELEKEITYLSFPLPDERELAEILEGIIATVNDNPQIVISVDEDDKEAMVKAALGLTAIEAENAFAKAIVMDSSLQRQDLSVILSEKEQIIRKTGFLEYFHSSEEFSSVGGMSVLKEWLRRRGKAFSEKARAFGLPAPKGVLLIGVQGCGKSLTAKAVAGLWQMPLLRLDIGGLFGSWIGMSEENTRKALLAAEAISPCILWLDEIEKGLSGFQSSGVSDAGTTARVFSTIVTWLQEKEKPVFVIATANEISQLPPELIRKGRFDEIFFVDLPKEAERKEIFAIHLRKRRRKPENFDLDELVRLTDGFSGAEIEQVVISALYDAFYEGRDLAQADLVRSARETMPLSHTMREQIEALREWAKGRARFASE